MLRDMRADRDEHRIEPAGSLLRDHILDLVVEHDPHAHLLDPADLGHQFRARQPIGGDAEVHHAAGHRPRLVDLHLMAESCEVIGG